MRPNAALRPLLAILVALTFAAPVAAADIPTTVERWVADPFQIFDAAEVDLVDFKWIALPVVVFADTPRDPAFIEQMEELIREMPRLIERNVVVITDTDPATRTALRDKLRPRGFMLVLIGQDGQVKERKPQPRTVRELSRSINKMPTRQRDVNSP